MSRENNSYDNQLNALFQAYRAALPDRDPGPAFMPRLWERIEARRSFTLTFRRLTQVFVTGAAAICILLALLLTAPTRHTSPLYSATYLEVLADNNPPENLAYVDVPQLEWDEITP